MPTEYAIQIEYAAVFDLKTLIHTQRLRCSLASGDTAPVPGDIPATVSLATRTDPATGISAQLALEAYVAVLIPTLADEITVVSAVLVAYENGLSGAGVYIAPFDLSDEVAFPALVGTNGTKGVAAGQETYTFFDTNGRTSKVVLMENTAANDVNAQKVYTEISIDGQDFIDYLAGSASWVQGTNGAFLSAFRRRSNTQNESIYRRRYR